ncbi:MAG: hypothetical protein LPH21_11585 [Shewanella sp.]|nr:hypothetical protein [Shewanella sp.]
MQEQQTTSYQRLCSERLSEISELSEISSKQAEELTQLRQQLSQSQKAAAKSAALSNELAVQRKQHKDLQAAWNAANPEKLKKQIKRLQEDNAAKQATIKQLQGAKAQVTEQRDTSRKETQRAITKIIRLEKELAHNQGAGIYHKQHEHLIIWPQVNTMQRPDGSTYLCRTLLYMHQSGRGMLLSYDPDLGETIMSSAPKGGLKPKKDTLDFAHNWLFKVNNLQNGICQDEDMVAVNHNGEGLLNED